MSAKPRPGKSTIGGPSTTTPAHFAAPKADRPVPVFLCGHARAAEIHRKREAKRAPVSAAMEALGNELVDAFARGLNVNIETEA